MNLNKKKVLATASAAIFTVILAFLYMLKTKYLLSNTLVYFTAFLILTSALVYIIVDLFNGKLEFDLDSLSIFCLHFFPLTLVLVVEGLYSQPNTLYGITAIIVIFFYSLYFWFIYLARCINALNDIKQNKHVFCMKAIKSILASLLVCLSGTVVILSLSPKNTVLKVIYQIVNIIVNTTYPFIDMYIYVRSEIDEFDKQEKNEIEKNKIEKKQFNDVEQFINNCTNSDNLDDLEKNINKKRKKLEKGKFAGVKKIVKICEKKFVEICDKKYVKEFVEICNRRDAKINAKYYVKKFATLKDLDSLEKIITEKRDDLEKK